MRESSTPVHGTFSASLLSVSETNVLKPRLLLSLLIVLLAFLNGRLQADHTPSTLEFRLATDADSSGWKKMDLRGSSKPIFVSDDVALNGSHIEKVAFCKDKNGDPSVGLALTEDGAKAMEAATSENLGKRLAIVLNGKVVSAPVIQNAISKDAQITGRFDRDELLAFFHAIVLREVP